MSVQGLGVQYGTLLTSFLGKNETAYKLRTISNGDEGQMQLSQERYFKSVLWQRHNL